jgi:hypothetical protein
MLSKVRRHTMADVKPNHSVLLAGGQKNRCLLLHNARSGRTLGRLGHPILVKRRSPHTVTPSTVIALPLGPRPITQANSDL